MFRSVLIPTDGSAGAEAPIAHATELGRAYDAAIHTLYVVDSESEAIGVDADGRAQLQTARERRGREATIRVVNRAEDHDLEAAREIREGVPHREILAYADDQDVDIIVMGTHGRTGADRVRLGSTTERVITQSDVPVLSVRLADDGEETVPEAARYDRVVIPTDGSDAAERAAATALDIVEPYDTDVHAVYVVDSATYDFDNAPTSIVGLLKEGGGTATETIAEMARERDLDVKTTIRRGVPAAELLDYASGVDADLVAMGTRGRSVGSGRLLGSTTARVVRRSSVPVLTVT